MASRVLLVGGLMLGSAAVQALVDRAPERDEPGFPFLEKPQLFSSAVARTS